MRSNNDNHMTIEQILAIADELACAMEDFQADAEDNGTWDSVAPAMEDAWLFYAQLDNALNMADLLASEQEPE